MLTTKFGRAILALSCGLATTIWADPQMNTGGQLGVSRTVTSYMLGQGSVNAGASLQGEYAYDGIYTASGKASPTLLGQDIFCGYGLTNWLDLNIDLPIYEDIWSGHSSNPVGAGDLQVGAKVQHPGLYKDAPFRIAYLLRASFPTGASKAGYFPRYSYVTTTDTLARTKGAYTNQSWSLNPNILWTLDLDKFPSRIPLQFNLNAGATFVYLTDRSDRRYYSMGLASLQAQYQATPSTGIFAEISGTSKVMNFTNDFNLGGDWTNDVLRFTLGGSYKSTSGWYGSLGADVGLSDRSLRTKWTRDGETYTTSHTPRFGLTLTLGFSHKGANAKPFLGRFFGSEDTILVIKRDTVKKVDTVKVIKNDTVLIVKKDTVKVIETQNPKTIIQYGILALRSINFLAGSAELTRSSYATLDDIAQSLATYPEVKLEVRGYTDATGSSEVNQKLSQARAESVTAYLEKKGIAANRLKSIGMGPANPVASNGTLEGRVLNRRVEIRRFDATK